MPNAYISDSIAKAWRPMPPTLWGIHGVFTGSPLRDPRIGVGWTAARAEMRGRWTYAFIITVTWWRSARKGVAKSDSPLFVSIPQRLVFLRPPHLFSFLFPPNPSNAFITTVTWWRSARKGVAQSDLPLFVSVSLRLVFLRPPHLFFCLPNPFYASITTVNWWRSARKGVVQRDLPLFVSIPQRLVLLRPPHLFCFFSCPTRPMPL